MQYRRTIRFLFLVSVGLIAVGLMTVRPKVIANDWPMWRGDAGHTGVSADPLPLELSLQWVRKRPAPRPAWPESQHKLRFDAVDHPVIADGRMFVSSTVNDSVTAYRVDTGEQLWQFFTNAPVRFAPVVLADRVYVGGDDGYLYCLNGADGSLVWKLNGGPTDRTVIGNHRLISMWPIRGGAVAADGRDLL